MAEVLRAVSGRGIYAGSTVAAAAVVLATLVAGSAWLRPKPIEPETASFARPYHIAGADSILQTA